MSQYYTIEQYNSYKRVSIQISFKNSTQTSYFKQLTKMIDCGLIPKEATDTKIGFKIEVINSSLYNLFCIVSCPADFNITKQWIEEMITKAERELQKQINRVTEAFKYIELWNSLHPRAPQFNSRTTN